MSVGNRIKAIRKSRGKNQTEFAQEINATLPAVSNWETGRNIPNNERLKAIADIGGITVEELLHGNNATNKIEIGKRIKNIRINLNETTADFGKHFNPPSSNSLVSRWERGVNLPNNKRINKIAELGNITVEELLYGDTYFKSLKIIKEEIRKAYEFEKTDEVFKHLKGIENYINTVINDDDTLDEIMDG